MTQPADRIRSVVTEKIFPHPPDKVWRALTDRGLLAEWLLPNDFKSEVGERFQFRNEPVGGWDGVIECKVLAIDPATYLCYSWQAFGLESTVQFTLTTTDGGTHVRMEHSGFLSDQEAAYKGAHYGWQRFLGNLEKVLREDAL